MTVAQAYPLTNKNGSHRADSMVYHYSQMNKVVPSSECHLLPSLGRLSMVKKDFTTAFVFPSPYLLPMPMNERIIPDKKTLVTSFEVKKLIDSGGTLRLLLWMDPSNVVSTASIKCDQFKAPNQSWTENLVEMIVQCCSYILYLV